MTLLLSPSLLSVSDSWRSSLDHTVNFLISLWEIIKFIVINLLETPTVIPLSLTDSWILRLPDRAHGDIRK